MRATEAAAYAEGPSMANRAYDGPGVATRTPHTFHVKGLRLYYRLQGMIKKSNKFFFGDGSAERQRGP